MSNQQRITIIELVQGFCTRTYGSAPCTAALGVTGNHKCSNTEVTCQDAVHYDGDPNAVPYLSLPGTIGNFVETPNSVALAVLTGDLDIRMKVSVADWTPALGFDFMDKIVADFVQFSFVFRLNPAGTLTIYTSPDGVTLQTQQSTADLSALVNGSTKWVRVTLDIDNGAGQSATTFYSSDDGVTWTQLGSVVLAALITNVFVGTATLQIGGSRSGVAGQHSGNTYYAEIRNGINGTVVAKFDPSYNEAAYNASTFLSETGERWTINTSGGTPAKLVCPALQLRFTQPQDGLDQYGYLLPSLQSVGITPAEINLAAMERNAGALGQREVVTAAMIDHQHSDFLTDRYRLERETGVASTVESGTAAAYGSLQFDGTNRHVDLPLSVNTMLDGLAWSVEFWFQTSSSGSFTILGHRAQIRQREIGWNTWTSGNSFGFAEENVVATGQSATGITLNVPHHVVCTYDGTTIRFYVDGVPSTAGAGWTPSGNATGQNCIGDKDTLGVTSYLTGLVDEFRIYTRTLTPQEIADHFCGRYANESGLGIYLPFEENSGTSAIDHSPNGNNATLFGSPIRAASLAKHERKNVIKLRSGASAVEDFYKGKNVSINSGTGSVQTRKITAYSALTHLATLDREWSENFITWSEDSAGHWVVGDVANPFTPNSTDVAAPDGTFTATKWTLNLAAAVNRSFTPSYAAMPAIPGSTICFSFYVWIPSTNSNNPLTAYAFSNTDIAGFGQLLDLNKLPRNQWVLASWVHTWSAASTANVNPQFHSNAADTLGDKMYVWKPKLNYGTERGEYIRTLGAAAVLAPDSTSVYAVFEEAYSPFNKGTFWGKWIARNPYYSNFPVTMREGLVGQKLSEMRVHKYSIDRFEGPTGGAVSMVAKDLFTKIETRKSVAPLASNGRLLAGVTAAAGQTFTLVPAGVGNLEYPASGFLVIGEEECGFTRAADVVTLTTRGQSNTTPATHNADDLAQLVLVFTPSLAKDIVYTLLSTYTKLTASQLPLAEWTTAMAAVVELYSAHICVPTPVLDLIGELSEQAGFTVFPNTVTGLIKMVALRAGAASVIIDDAMDMIDGSISVKRQDSRRASQVWVYYSQRNPLKSLSEKTNYASRTLNISLAAETQYGTPAIREVFSRWIPLGGRATALKTGGRMLELFRNPPIEARFKVVTDDWDSKLSLAQFVAPLIDEIQDDTGNRLATVQAVLSIERDDNQLEVTTQEVSLIPEDPLAERFIYIDSDSHDLNMRTVHDSLYATPNGTETIHFVVSAGVKVGATSTSAPALRTGTWPAGVVLKLENLGRIQGRGGDGGSGGDFFQIGFPGGDALKAEYAVAVDNLNGQIWSGGGGSAPSWFYGLGGNGGAGFDPGNGGPLGAGGYARAGNPGTTEVGGARNYYTASSPFSYAGAGGGPGLAAEDGNFSGTFVIPGGAAGKYIVGNSFVTWVNNGDRRGGVA